MTSQRQSACAHARQTVATTQVQRKSSLHQMVIKCISAAITIYKPAEGALSLMSRAYHVSTCMYVVSAAVTRWRRQVLRDGGGAAEDGTSLRGQTALPLSGE